MKIDFFASECRESSRKYNCRLDVNTEITIKTK